MTSRAELNAEKWEGVWAAFIALSASRLRADGLRLVAAVGVWLPFADEIGVQRSGPQVVRVVGR